MLSPSELLRQHGLRADKRLGQCFLHDAGVVDRIVALSGLQKHELAIEIGAGLGILTCALGRACDRVVAIERDQRLLPVLAQVTKGLPITVIEGDALDVDFSEVAGATVQARVVANLPYNISTPLVFRMLEQRAAICSATVMVQKEVAQRIAAAPGSKDYGAPSVICQQYADVTYGFHVGRGAFTPAPRIDSAVIRLDMRKAPRAECEEDVFRRTVRAAFGQRRKTLLRALSRDFALDAVRAALDAAAIEGKRRGETLCVEEFAAIARNLC